jgi:hypothetical protein
MAEFEVKLVEKEEYIKKIKHSNEALKKRVNDSSEEIRKRQLIIANLCLILSMFGERKRKKSIEI